MSDVIEPFLIQVDDSALEDLRSRLAHTRFPNQIAETEWEVGIPVAYLRELVTYWMDGYDWRREEARLNRLDHFRTRIDGQSIHFVHVRSPHAEAMPPAAHPRLAGFVRRVPRRRAPSHRSAGIRWPSRRCIPPRDAVVARLRVLGAACSAGGMFGVSPMRSPG